MEITGSPVWANAAPMAAGSEKPMVPSPPEVIMVRGCMNVKNCAAHIWCCPTSVTTMAFPPVASPIARITCWVRNALSG